VRPAAEIEPVRAICSSTAILPGPILPPDASSILMLSRSPALAASESLRGRLGMTASKPQRKSIDQSERVTWPFAHFIADHTTPIRHSEVSMASGVNGKPPVLVKLLPRGGRVPDHKPSCQAAALANANRHLRHAYLKL
jgi:hypothetical protein